jgi:hypothetical protein
MNGPLFSAKNFKLLWVSIGLLVIGYILLAQGPIYNHLSWTIAPIVLVVVYCILLPWSIIAKDSKEEGAQKSKGV